jgi:hypothetical protein
MRRSLSCGECYFKKSDEVGAEAERVFKHILRCVD